MSKLKVLTQVDCRYLISENGEVYSLFGSRGLRKKYKKLKTQIDDKGYVKVTVFLDSGKRFATRVHRLVASAFLNLNLYDKNLHVHHKDENKQNNHFNNLEIKHYTIHCKEALQKKRTTEKHFFTEQEKKKLSGIGFSEWEEHYKTV
jgi:hypothetical protein